MLMPKRVRHRKVQRGRMSGIAKGGSRVAYGDFGIQALEPGWITNRQIEASRIAMTRHIKRGGKVWITIFPDKPVTQKPAETRMGSGKGNPEHWVAVVKPGRIMFELSGVTEDVAREAMRLAMHKLPIKTRFVARVGAERLSTGRAETNTRLLLQLELVGLSQLGSNALGVLRDNIPGYRPLSHNRSAPLDRPYD